MSRILIIVVVATCLVAGGQATNLEEEQEAIDRLLSAEPTEDDQLAADLLENKIGRDVELKPLGIIVGQLIDLDQISELNCRLEALGELEEIQQKLPDCLLAAYIKNKRLALRDSCGQLMHAKFTTIVSELEQQKETDLSALMKFLKRLDPRIKNSAHMLDFAEFDELIASLAYSNNKLNEDGEIYEHLLGPIMENCRTINGRLANIAPLERVWNPSWKKRDELTQRWLAKYAICRTLTEPNILAQEVEEKWSLIVRYIDPSLAKLSHYLASLPDEVALERRRAMIPDELIAEKVAQFMGDQQKGSPKETHSRKGRDKSAQLGDLEESCRQVNDLFELYLWLVDGGFKQHFNREQVQALKLARVCQLLPSIEFHGDPGRRSSKHSLANVIKRTMGCLGCMLPD